MVLTYCYYHRRCYQYFMSSRNLKLDAPSTTTGGMVLKKRGRPSGAVDQEKKSTFMHVIEYLENNDDETVTLDELHEIMEKEAGGGEVYSKRSPQRQLYAHYGSRVSITSSKRQPLIVMLLSSNVTSVNSRSTSQFNDDSKDMDSLIKVLRVLNNTYICIHSHNLAILSPSLRLLPHTVIKSKTADLRCSSIGH